MRNIARYAIAAAVGASVFFVFQYLNPVPSRETADVNCILDAEDGAIPLNVPNSREIVKKVEFSGEMTGRYTDKETGTDLWHADGEVRFAGNSQRMSGAIFLTTTNEVRGVMLYRDRYPHQAVDLRISTLNENSNLDWDEARAYVYFEGAEAKLDHPFAYRCKIRKATRARSTVTALSTGSARAPKRSARSSAQQA